jgi:hypothetical protein
MVFPNIIISKCRGAATTDIHKYALYFLDQTRLVTIEHNPALFNKIGFTNVSLHTLYFRADLLGK